MLQNMAEKVKGSREIIIIFKKRLRRKKVSKNDLVQPISLSLLYSRKAGRLDLECQAWRLQTNANLQIELWDDEEGGGDGGQSEASQRRITGEQGSHYHSQGSRCPHSSLNPGASPPAGLSGPRAAFPGSPQTSLHAPGHCCLLGTHTTTRGQSDTATLLKQTLMLECVLCGVRHELHARERETDCVCIPQTEYARACEAYS